MKRIASTLAILLLLGTIGHSQSISIPNTFSNGTTADANQVNANFTALATNACNVAACVLTGTMTPSSSNALDLGSSSLFFRTLYAKTSVILGQTSGNYTLTWANPAAARAISIADPGGTDVFTFNAATQTLSNKTLASPVFSGTATGTGIPGTAISAGVVAVARLGTGSPSSGNYLRGDGAWTSIGGDSLIGTISGTSISGSAATVGNVSIVGLTNKDTLHVQVTMQTVGGTTTVTPSLYHSTDMVTLITGASVTTNGLTFWDLWISCDPSSDTNVQTTGTRGTTTTAAAMTATASLTTNYPGTTWNLGLRHASTDGTFHYRMVVYLHTGQ